LLVTHFIAVTVGTVEDIPRPPLGKPRDAWQFVSKPGGNKEASGGNAPAV
jgi:hypothetical protein